MLPRESGRYAHFHATEILPGHIVAAVIKVAGFISSMSAGFSSGFTPCGMYEYAGRTVETGRFRWCFISMHVNDFSALSLLIITFTK